MTTSMVVCPECGQWYFNHKKLSQHLIAKHDYEVELKEETDGEPTATQA